MENPKITDKVSQPIKGFDLSEFVYQPAEKVARSLSKAPVLQQYQRESLGNLELENRSEQESVRMSNWSHQTSSFIDNQGGGLRNSRNSSLQSLKRRYLSPSSQKLRNPLNNSTSQFNFTPKTRNHLFNSSYNSFQKMQNRISNIKDSSSLIERKLGSTIPRRYFAELDQTRLFMRSLPLEYRPDSSMLFKLETQDS